MVTGEELLTLEEGRWYGWQMLPGYTGPDDYDPYYSPIRVDKVTPRKTGRGILTLDFYNAGYAQGVQGFRLDMRVLQHAETYLVARLIYEPEDWERRAAVISILTSGWIDQNCTWFDPRRHPDLERQLATGRDP